MTIKEGNVYRLPDGEHYVTLLRLRAEVWLLAQANEGEEDWMLRIFQDDMGEYLRCVIIEPITLALQTKAVVMQGADLRYESTSPVRRIHSEPIKRHFTMISTSLSEITLVAKLDETIDLDVWGDVFS